MHTLTLVRHGTSESPLGVTDRDRILNARGESEVVVMARHLKEQGLVPSILLSSDATRAKMTAQVFAETLGVKAHFDAALYNTDEVAVLNILRSIKEEVSDVMLVGHNPTWEALVMYLSNNIMSMIPATVVQILLPCPWKEIKEGAGEVIYYDHPEKV